MYYCKHCGNVYQTDEAVICVKCGAPKGRGMNFCQNCGNAVQPGTNVCMNCGVSVKEIPSTDAKSKLAAGLFGIFLGCFGVHNFYLGYTGKAVAQLVLTIVGILLSCVVVGVFFIIATSIWGLVEGIMILTGSISTDANGQLLKD